MHDFLDWFQTTDIFSLSLVSLSLALAATLISYLLMRIALRFAVGRMRKIAQHTTNRVDDTVVEVLSSTNRWLMLLAALLIGLGMLDLNDRWNSRVGQLWFVAVALQLGLWLTRAISIGLRRYQDRHTPSGMTQAGASATLMSWALRTVLWAVVLLAVLSNVGVNITAFVASLGVGDSSLDYEVVYIVKEPDYNTYMDAQQTLNLQLMRELATLGVDFAFPTRTVYLVPGSDAGTVAGEGASDKGASHPPIRSALN